MRVWVLMFVMAFSINGIAQETTTNEEDEGVWTLQDQQQVKKVIKKRDKKAIRQEKREARKQRRLARKQMKRKQRLVNKIQKEKSQKESVIHQNHQQKSNVFDDIKGIFAKRNPYKQDRPHDF